MLLAGMGEPYIDKHPWAKEKWFQDRHLGILQKFRENGINVRNYSPISK